MKNNICLVGGFMDTRSNNEDFALTPYLLGVWSVKGFSKVRGIGICWGYYSVYIGIGWNIPKGFSRFKIFN